MPGHLQTIICIFLVLCCVRCSLQPHTTQEGLLLPSDLSVPLGLSSCSDFFTLSFNGSSENLGNWSKILTRFKFPGALLYFKPYCYPFLWKRKMWFVPLRDDVLRSGRQRFNVVLRSTYYVNVVPRSIYSA
jgi:hypothetical protein